MSLKSLIVATLALIAPAAPALAQDAFPVTIQHAYGQTTIEKQPLRVVTWGWGTQDAVIALGVVPVAMPFFSYGGGEDGIHEWTMDTLTAMGADTPTILPDAQQPPIEAIAAAQPDVILAVFSGITEQEYKALSGIAPVVAFPGDPWGTSWQDTVRIVGKALGKSAEAQKLVDDATQFMADEVAKYPQIPGTTFIAVNAYDGSLAIYDALDARVKFLTDLGLVLAPAVTELSPKDGSFYYSLSFEQSDKLVSDIFVSYSEERAKSDDFWAQFYMADLPQVKNGAYASLVGTELVASVSPPSILSLKWGFPTYIGLIAEAAANAKN